MFFRFSEGFLNFAILILIGTLSYIIGHKVGFKSGYIESGYDMVHANKIIGECHNILTGNKDAW